MTRKLVMSNLLAALERCPEGMRLGEFLTNGLHASTLREDPFYASDEAILASFEALAAKFPKKGGKEK